MKQAFLFASAITIVITACSSSSTSTNNNNTDAGGGGNKTDGGGTGGGDAGNGTTGAQDCMSYCTTIMANCSGATQQFGGMDQCMNSCKAFPMGTAADMMGNTLGCRIYHAGAAKADPMTHCKHAGPGGAGVCGANCDGYCQIAMMYCTSANMAQVYTDLNDCKTTCAKFPDMDSFNVTDTTLQDKNSVECLLYHVQEASAAPADHCNGDLAKPEAGAGSTTCNK
jgi:hypothetical protein